MAADSVSQGCCVQWAIAGWDPVTQEAVAGGVRVWPRGSQDYVPFRNAKREFCRILGEAAALAELWVEHGPGVLVITDQRGDRVDPFGRQPDLSALEEDAELLLLQAVLDAA